VFPAATLADLGLPGDVFTSEGIEFYGQVSLLKAGIRYSDRLSTVSPSYAREIMTPDQGCGLDGLLHARARHLHGILNGVDYRLWNPGDDPHLAEGFTARDLSGKRACKAELQRELGLDIDPDIPLIVSLSRITHQKMADVVLDALPDPRPAGPVCAPGRRRPGDAEPVRGDCAQLARAVLRRTAAIPSQAPIDCLPVVTSCCIHPASSRAG
jgi:glycogen synthase